jgi:hypothetical protein
MCGFATSGEFYEGKPSKIVSGEGILLYSNAQKLYSIEFLPLLYTILQNRYAGSRKSSNGE